jgi:hypothetical protein
MGLIFESDSDREFNLHWRNPRDQHSFLYISRSSPQEIETALSLNKYWREKKGISPPPFPVCQVGYIHDNQTRTGFVARIHLGDRAEEFTTELSAKLFLEAIAVEKASEIEKWESGRNG